MNWDDKSLLNEINEYFKNVTKEEFEEQLEECCKDLIENKK